MGALLNAILGIGSFIGSIFSFFMFIIEGSVQWVSTAFSVIEGLPSYFVFLPAGPLMILLGALGIHIVRTILGR